MKENIKNSAAPQTTITYDKNKIDAPTGNIYESISIISKRADQIKTDVNKELLEKLENFSVENKEMEEIFDSSKERIDVSKHYEKMPKPHAIAVKEWLDGKISYRRTEQKD